MGRQAVGDQRGGGGLGLLAQDVGDDDVPWRRPGRARSP
jgi:hypothetical protein